MVLKKRKSKRLSTRKKNKILKKIRKQDKDRRKSSKEKSKSRSKIPKQILMTDEEVQKLQEIKDNEKQRREMEIQQHKEDLENFCKNKDFIFCIVDPRDVILPSSKIDVLIINYRNDIPIEIVENVYKNLSNSYNCFVISKNKLNKEFLEFTTDLKNKKIGIIGQSKVGKNYVRKLINLTDIETYSTNCEQGLSGLLRQAVSFRNVLYKDLIRDFINNKIDKDKLSHYYKIRYFEDFEDFVGLMSEKKNIKSDCESEVCKMILNEFYNYRFKFYKNDHGEFVFLF